VASLAASTGSTTCVTCVSFPVKLQLVYGRECKQMCGIIILIVGVG